MTTLSHRLLLTLLCAAMATLLCGLPRGLGVPHADDPGATIPAPEDRAR